MHVKSLKVFCDIVGRRSFSRAAADNGISQSAASQIVHQLEDGLGVKLIDRSKRPFVLTPEGEVYYDGCHKLVQRYFTLQEEVRSLHQAVEGRVNVASIYSVGLSYGKQLVAEFTRLHPKATVHIEFHHPSRVYELVSEDQVDIGLVSYAQSTRTIRAENWCDESMILVCAPEHPLVNRPSVRLADLDGLEIIGFDPDLKIRRKVDRYLAEHGVEVSVDIAFDNVDTIKRAIEVNAGASFVPETAVRNELAGGSLRAVPVEDLDLKRPLGIIHRRGVELGKTARCFIQLLQEASSPECETDCSPSSGDTDAGGSNGSSRSKRNDTNTANDDQAVSVR